MKHFQALLLLLSGILASPLFAQSDPNFNLQLLAHLPYPGAAGSSCWGYTAPNGTEYAIMGTSLGTSIVSLANPSNPVEVAFAEGPIGIWREMKTYGNYAYVTSDQGNAGLLIIDLSNLPNSISSSYYRPVLTVGTVTDTLKRQHSITMDEDGYMYLNGTNIDKGQPLAFDVHTTPGQPIYIGPIGNLYTHDSYARNDTIYVSNIYNGRFTIYNIADRANPILLGNRVTASALSHNVWLSDNGKYIFNTDERINAPITSYDVSNPADIKEISRFIRPQTANIGTIPHNVHVNNDWLVTAYYTDGVSIIDGHRPENMVEVAHYDTYPGPETMFHGVWGVYPYFQSGNIIASDIETGLWIFKPTYQRACYLEGKVTDANTNANLKDVEITVVTDATLNRRTNPTGDYKSGRLQPGTITVRAHKYGYIDQQLTVSLATEQITIANFQLQQSPKHIITGQVLDEATQLPVPNAAVAIKNETYNHDIVADANGMFADTVSQDTYHIFAGKWTYRTAFQTNQFIDQPTNVVLKLEKGIEDIFEVELGWYRSATPTLGRWDRAQPIQTNFNAVAVANPGQDSPADVGNSCFTTDNRGGGASDYDVDNGNALLISPEFDATEVPDMAIQYDAWYYIGNTGFPNDTMFIWLSNGTDTALVEQITPEQQTLSTWRGLKTYRIADFITPTATMKINVSVLSIAPSEVLEGGFDAFSTVQFLSAQNPMQTATLAVTPNPFSNYPVVTYSIPAATHTQATLCCLYNQFGQKIATTSLATAKGTCTFEVDLPAGMYTVRIESPNGNSQPLKMIKTR